MCFFQQNYCRNKNNYYICRQKKRNNEKAEMLDSDAKEMSGFIVFLSVEIKSYKNLNENKLYDIIVKTMPNQTTKREN